MTYTPILNAEVDAESPITDLLLTRLRDNPIDEDAPLKCTVLLGTLTTTSGATHTLSGLVLTPYKFLKIVLNGVSITGATFSIVFAGKTLMALQDAAKIIFGYIDVSLATGVFTSSLAEAPTGSRLGTNEITINGDCGVTTASTSLSFTGNGRDYDAGQILIYGVK